MGQSEPVDGLIRRTFTGMREQALRAGLTIASNFDAGIRVLLRTAETNGTICHTFFEAPVFSEGLR